MQIILEFFLNNIWRCISLFVESFETSISMFDRRKTKYSIHIHIWFALLYYIKKYVRSHTYLNTSNSERQRLTTCYNWKHLFLFIECADLSYVLLKSIIFIGDLHKM